MGPNGARVVRWRRLRRQRFGLPRLTKRRSRLQRVIVRHGLDAVEGQEEVGELQQGSWGGRGVGCARDGEQGDAQVQARSGLRRLALLQPRLQLTREGGAGPRAVGQRVARLQRDLLNA